MCALYVFDKMPKWHFVVVLDSDEYQNLEITIIIHVYHVLIIVYVFYTLCPLSTCSCNGHASHMHTRCTFAAHEGFGLRAFLSTFWFLLCVGMYTDFSFKVERTIGTKLGTTTWLQQIFSSFSAIGLAIKHLACILRDSFSHFSLSTSYLDKTSLASKSTIKHSKSFSFSREFQQVSYTFQPICWIHWAWQSNHHFPKRTCSNSHETS